MICHPSALFFSSRLATTAGMFLLKDSRPFCRSQEKQEKLVLEAALQQPWHLALLPMKDREFSPPKKNDIEDRLLLHIPNAYSCICIYQTKKDGQGKIM